MSAPAIGDKILFVACGPRGCVLVVSVVDQMTESRRFPGTFIGGVVHGHLITEHNEGFTWIRGDDRDSPEAHALLVAVVLAP